MCSVEAATSTVTCLSSSSTFIPISLVVHSPLRHPPLPFKTRLRPLRTSPPLLLLLCQPPCPTTHPPHTSDQSERRSTRVQGGLRLPDFSTFWQPGSRAAPGMPSPGHIPGRHAVACAQAPFTLQHVYKAPLPCFASSGFTDSSIHSGPQ